jgi:DNA-binding transcriptional regulator YiaG
MTYTSWNIKARRINTARDPEHRAQLAQRFKTTYASLGLSIDDVANLLHVTPRTLHNWNSGRYDIPYAAFKLLRVLMRYELPHDDWAGWHFSGGKLWTPEGYSIAPHESSWWSLLVRRAQMFSSLYARCHQLEAQSIRPPTVELCCASLSTDAIWRAGWPGGTDTTQRSGLIRTMARSVSTGTPLSNQQQKSPTRGL